MDLKRKKCLTKLAYSALGNEVLRVCRQINDSRCIGCQYGHPSQLRHECVTETSYNIFTVSLKSMHWGRTFQNHILRI